MVRLDRDVAEVFHGSAEVNETLRLLIRMAAAPAESLDRARAAVPALLERGGRSVLVRETSPEYAATAATEEVAQSPK